MSKSPRRDREDFVEVSIKMIKVPMAATEKAQLYSLDDRKFWLPFSVVKEVELDDQRIPNQVLVKMPMWLATNNKLEHDIE